MAGTKPNALAELARLGITYKPQGGEWILIHCPFHADNSPSCSVATQAGNFKCHACDAHGDFTTLLCGLLKQPRHVVQAELDQRYGSKAEQERAIVGVDIVESYHNAIWRNDAVRQELYNRGVTDALISYYRLGYIEKESRIAIPVKGESGQWVNVRKYLPGAPGADKFRNVKGHGDIALYPLEQLQFDNLIICGGELKAIVAAYHCNSHGYGAISTTAGEGKWHRKFNDKLKGKRLWVCLDVDNPGIMASDKLCKELRGVGASLANVDLSQLLDRAKYPKGDLNDYFGQEGGSAIELINLLQLSPQWADDKLHTLVARVATDTTEQPEPATIAQAVSSAFVGKRVEIRAMIAATDSAPSPLPRTIDVVCPKDQDICKVCNVYPLEPALITVSPESPVILDMLGTTKEKLNTVLQDACGIPLQCQVCELRVQDYHHVEDCRISPELQIANRNDDRTLQQAVCVLDNGERGLASNEPYVLIGRSYPSPLNQKSAIVISSAQPARSALSVFADEYHERALEYRERLSVFWPEGEWSVESIGKQLNAIYADLENNVTRIYKRREIHLFADLAYHSPLLINFDGKQAKGWVEILILGDTSQGKSEVVCGSAGPGGLWDYYGLGDRADSANATEAGLIGGCQQLGTKWFVTWGAMPQGDKRLVILEELNKLHPSIVTKMSDMRSSGVAEITKIEKRRTHARTRLIALSNTKAEGGLSAYNYGIEAVREVIQAPEAIRRFDAVLLVSRKDITADALNIAKQDRPDVPHVYTRQLCQELVLWAWTRTVEQVIIDSDTVQCILEHANRLCDLFTDDIPVVDRGSMRLKLARLAAALAARLYCTDESGESLIVLPAHVDYIASKLEFEYSRSSNGYRDYTVSLASTRIIDEMNIRIVKRQICALHYPKAFAEYLLHRELIDIQDVQDVCAVDRMEASIILSVLLRNRALIRDGKAYRKTEGLIGLLKTWLETGELTVGAPDFIPPKQEEF